CHHTHFSECLKTRNLSTRLPHFEKCCLEWKHHVWEVRGFEIRRFSFKLLWQFLKMVLRYVVDDHELRRFKLVHCPRYVHVFAQTSKTFGKNSVQQSHIHLTKNLSPWSC